MNPFETPPSGDPVQIGSPVPAAPRSNRGRMALVVLLTAGVVGGGIAGIAQFASADRPELSSTAPDEPSDETLPAADEDSDDQSQDEGPDDGRDEDRPDERDGQIVIDVDGEDPVVVDLGDLDDGTFDRLHECLGLPAFDLGEFDIGEFPDWRPGQLPPGALDDFFEDLPSELGDLGELDVFGGESVTVTGPDGVSVIDLGENGSVTVTKEDGELTIDTTGDATVEALDDLFGDFTTVFEGAFGDGQLDEFLEGLPNFDDGQFDEFLEGLPNADELPEIEPLDPDAIRTCVDEVLGN